MFVTASTSPAWQELLLRSRLSPVGSRNTAGWRSHSPAETPSALVNPLDPGSLTNCPPAAQIQLSFRSDVKINVEQID